MLEPPPTSRAPTQDSRLRTVPARANLVQPSPTKAVTDDQPASLARDQIIQVARRFLSTGLERSRPRVSVELPVQITNPILTTSGRAHNISRGGGYIEADCQIPLKTRVDLEIGLPEMGRSISPGGTVVWQREGGKPGLRGMGIEFVQIAPEEMRALTDFIDLRRTNPPSPSSAFLM